MRTQSSYQRKISESEQTYVVLNRLFSPSTVQLIVEGQGEIALDVFQEAVHRACIACPGVRVKKQGAFWVDNQRDPQVTALSACPFDGYNFDDIDLFRKRIDPESDAPIEIIFLGKNPFRILFRIFHGIMDAKGAMLWIDNIFAAMRGEPLTEAHSTETDYEFVETQGGRKKAIEVRLDCRLTLPRPMRAQQRLSYKRLTLSNNYLGLVPRLAQILSVYFADQKTRYIIPVDLRRHDPAICSTANLLLPIYLESKRDDSWPDIYKKMADKLRQKEELNLSNATFGIFFYLPLYLQILILRSFIYHCNRTRVFLNSGIISNVGRVSLDKYSMATFEATTIHFLPAHHPLTPFSIATSEYDKRTEIIIGSYENVISTKDIEEILERIKHQIGHMKKSRV